MSVDRLDTQTIDLLFGEADHRLKHDFETVFNQLIDQTSVLTGAVVPTFKASQHQWYLDTVTQKYYRNVDGGTTWVALN